MGVLSELLNEKEPYKIPDALMQVMLDDVKRVDLLRRIKQKVPTDAIDPLRDEFQEEQGDRNKLKQDYTPDCLCELVSSLIPNGETYADICSGTGALTIATAHNNRRQAFFQCEEMASRAVPFLLANLSLNNLNADVYQEDALTCTVEAVYKVRAGEEFSTVEENNQGAITMSREYANIIMNPPYSLKLKTAVHPQFDGYPIPTNAADWLFVIHGLQLLADGGTLIAILPHGVLFRGNKEREIRIRLIEQNLLDAVIGLPGNMFMNTQIPTCLVILRKNRQRRDVLFIDASKSCTKQGKYNVMERAHIQAIVDEYTYRKGIPRFSSLVELSQLKENDWNLNIPRYVDTFVPEPVPDLQGLLDELISMNQQIRETENELLAMMEQLVGTTPAADEKIKTETRRFGQYLQDKYKFSNLPQLPKKGAHYDEGMCSLF